MAEEECTGTEEAKTKKGQMEREAISHNQSQKALHVLMK